VPTFPADTTVQLERPAMRLVVSQQLGSRVVSLLDRRTGREWLAPGRVPDAGALAAWAGEEAVFGGPEAFGWDECLPTVARTADPMNPQAPFLRDHGNFWGREAATSIDQGTIVTEWPADRWGLGFLRRLRLDASAVIADYALYNPTTYPVPFLWAAHPLLQLEPGTRLHLPRVDRVLLQDVRGVRLSAGRAAWPRAATADGGQADLDVVQAASAHVSIKAFARVQDGRAGALTPDGSWIGVAWDPSFAPMLGLWLDYGAWPETGPESGQLHQVALEPTTAARDALGDAIADGNVATVAPGRTVRWWLRLEVGTHPAGLGAFLRG
jgi:hypothetical protein